MIYMTYLNFLLLYIGIPLVGLALFAYRKNHPDKKYIFKGIAVLCGLAFVYTTPWDNYLLAQKVWWYGPDRILFTIGYVPIEEYTFFLAQTIFTGLWTFLVLSFSKAPAKASDKDKAIKYLKYFVSAVLFGVFFYGVNCLFYDQSFYMGLILAWAMPVVLLQFSIGGQHLLKNPVLFLACFFLPTLYLWRADLFAIRDGIWFISEANTIGIAYKELPIEEMIFFLITNIMVVQGLLLFLIMRDTVNQVVVARLKISKTLK